MEIIRPHRRAGLPLARPSAAIQFGRCVVSELIRGEDNPNLKLRVFVQGGGCSGFQYGFTFDENIEDGDTCVENRGVKLIVDPMSFQYLMGAEIDYREDIQGAQFVIRNPNAATTCGCGSSFAV
jgi:iron-sulfur cluster insertion protein